MVREDQADELGTQWRYPTIRVFVLGAFVLLLLFCVIDFVVLGVNVYHAARTDKSPDPNAVVDLVLEGLLFLAISAPLGMVVVCWPWKAGHPAIASEPPPNEADNRRRAEQMAAETRRHKEVDHVTGAADMGREDQAEASRTRRRYPMVRAILLVTAVLVLSISVIAFVGLCANLYEAERTDDSPEPAAIAALVFGIIWLFSLFLGIVLVLTVAYWRRIVGRPVVASEPPPKEVQ